jgi:hypothetical protein
MKHDYGPDSGLFLRGTRRRQAYQTLIDYHGGGDFTKQFVRYRKIRVKELDREGKLLRFGRVFGSATYGLIVRGNRGTFQGHRELTALTDSSTSIRPPIGPTV